MRFRLVVDYLVYLVVRALICIVQAMRIETAQKVANCLAWLLGDVIGVRAKVVDENLRHAFPDLSPHRRRQLARRMWEHLFLLVLEVAHAPRKIHETNWRRYVRLKDQPRLVRCLLDRRPTLIVTAHFGNFEAGGYILGVLGFPTYTVARTLDNPFLDRFINRFRGGTGQHVIPKKGGFDQILDVLANNGIMTLLADQHAGRKGCWVEFFGRRASAHKAIALLSLENDAPIVISYVKRLNRPLYLEMGTTDVADPRDADRQLTTIPDLTQWYTSELEKFIRQAPHQYWWVHRRWKDVPPRHRAKRKTAA